MNNLNTLVTRWYKSQHQVQTYKTFTIFYNLLELPMKINLFSHRLTGRWRNTYALTKACAENLLSKYDGILPIGILRPSIGELMLNLGIVNFKVLPVFLKAYAPLYCLNKQSPTWPKLLVQGFNFIENKLEFRASKSNNTI